MTEYLSCHYIQTGVNFYPNNLIKVCCFTSDPAVDACSVDEPDNEIIRKLAQKKIQMMTDFAAGNVYSCCSSCPNLVKANWGSDLKMISSITLNHFMFCNLKCGHCGYLEEMRINQLQDTDHARVKHVISLLKERGAILPSAHIDVGGGEPSVSEGLLAIVEDLARGGHKIHINSNGAKFIDTWADHANAGRVFLTLTPDAGSREVFKRIKGTDAFSVTWRNIKRYFEACRQNIEVKFILQDGNVDDIENMIAMCDTSGVRRVVISLDLRINKNRQSDFLGHVSLLRRRLQERNIAVTRSSLVPDALWVSG